MKGNTVKRSFISLPITLLFALTGCTTESTPMEPDANQIFKNLYTTVTTATSANGNHTKFRWKNNTEPFPYQEASWADTLPWHCDDTTAKVSFMATTYQQNLGTKNYQDQMKNVKAAWEAQGLTVRGVGASKGMIQIATDLPDGTVVVYTTGVAGEAVEAVTQCFTSFKADPATAITYPATTP